MLFSFDLMETKERQLFQLFLLLFYRTFAGVLVCVCCGWRGNIRCILPGAALHNLT